MQSQANASQQAAGQSRPKYPKKAGTSGISGQLYEIKLSMLVLLHAEKQIQDKKITGFHLASNMDGVGAFDDIVFRYDYRDASGNEKSSIIFLQAKHRETPKEEISLNTLFTTSGKKDFNLDKYFTSYQYVQNLFSGNDPLFNNVNFDDAEFIIFTNSLFVDGVKQIFDSKVVAAASMWTLIRDKNVYYQFTNTFLNTLNRSTNFLNFVSKVKLFVGQPGEKELDGILKEKIKSVYNVNENDIGLLHDQIQIKVTKWWKEEEVYYTETEKLYEETKNDLSKLKLIGLAISHAGQMDKLGIKLNKKQLKIIKYSIRLEKILNVITNKHTDLLTNIKIYQALEGMKKYKTRGDNFKYIFMSINNVLSMQSKVMSAFRSKEISVIVINCNGADDRIDAQKIEQLSDQLTEIIDSQKKKKIIVIGRDRQLAESLSKCRKYKEIKDENYSLLDFTSESQRKLLNKIVCLQGKDVSIATIIDDGLKHLIGTEQIGALINNEKIKIGKEPLTLGESKDYYIDRTFIPQSNFADECEEKNMNNIQDKIIIVSAEPGMGKSTVLTKLAIIAKKCFDSWVLRINLNDCTDELDKLELDAIEKEFLQFLISTEKLGTDLEKQIFERRFYQRGKISYFIDGFDEICPIYSGKVLELINIMKRNNTERIIITTRPYLHRELEDKLGVRSYRLKPLSKNDQKWFLKMFWSKRLELEENERFDTYIEWLFDLWSKFNADYENEFTGIPLQTRMLAEVFQGEFRTFYESNRSEPLPDNINIIKLYQRFIDKKFEIYYQEKNKADATKPRVKKQLENEKKNFIAKHKLLSLDMLFSNTCLSQILSKEKNEQLKDLKKNVNEGEETTGIISQIINGKPIFIHRTFAEYFAANWFTQNANTQNVKDSLPKILYNYDGLRNFFDRILADDEPGENKYDIHQAVLNKDTKTVYSLLSNLAKEIICSCDKAGRTALHLAASYRYSYIVKILLNKGADVNIVDDFFGWSPIAYAVRYRHWEIVDLLLREGASSDDLVQALNNIEELDYMYGDTLLHSAAREGNARLARVLIDKSADVKSLNRFKDLVNVSVESGQTPLHYAAEKGQLEVIKLLIERKADVNVTDNDGYPPLQYAVVKGQLEVMKLLIEYKADVNVVDKNGWTPLHLAVVIGQLELMKILIEGNANVNIASFTGMTPMHDAAYKGRLEVIKLLIEHNANVNVVHNDGWTPLHIAAGKGQLEVTKLLIEHNANVNVVNNDGWTPLYYAAEEGHLEVLKLFIECNADVNVANIVGWTPLHSAASRGHLHVVRCLLENGADFSVTNSGQTVLQSAVYGNLNVVRYLVEERNADISESVLQHAINSGRSDIVGYLRNKGAQNIGNA